MTRPFPEGILPLTRELGGYFEQSKPMDEPGPIDAPVFRPRREDLWPPEVWAEMQAIYADPTRSPTPA